MLKEIPTPLLYPFSRKATTADIAHKTKMRYTG